MGNHNHQSLGQRGQNGTQRPRPRLAIAAAKRGQHWVRDAYAFGKLWNGLAVPFANRLERVEQRARRGGLRYCCMSLILSRYDHETQYIRQRYICQAPVIALSRLRSQGVT